MVWVVHLFREELSKFKFELGLLQFRKYFRHVCLFGVELFDGLWYIGAPIVYTKHVFCFIFILSSLISRAAFILMSWGPHEAKRQPLERCLVASTIYLLLWRAKTAPSIVTCRVAIWCASACLPLEPLAYINSCIVHTDVVQVVLCIITGNIIEDQT